MADALTQAITTTLWPFLKNEGFQKVTPRKFVRERRDVFQQLWVDANGSGGSKRTFVVLCASLAASDGINHFAIRRRFWAVAAIKNSSCAPLSPRSRSRSSFMMRLRCANSISTFLRSLRDWLYCGDCAMDRAISRAPSWMLRAIFRNGVLGQQRSFVSQAMQSAWLAR